MTAPPQAAYHAKVQAARAQLAALRAPTPPPCTPQARAYATHVIEGRHPQPSGALGPVAIAVAACDVCRHHAVHTVRGWGLEDRDVPPRVPGVLCGDVDDRAGLTDPGTGRPLLPGQRRPAVLGVVSGRVATIDGMDHPGHVDCPGCAKRTAVTPTGRIRAHGFPAIPGGRPYVDCPWSRRRWDAVGEDAPDETGGDVVWVPVWDLPMRHDKPREVAP